MNSALIYNIYALLLKKITTKSHEMGKNMAPLIILDNNNYFYRWLMMLTQVQYKLDQISVHVKYFI